MKNNSLPLCCPRHRKVGRTALYPGIEVKLPGVICLLTPVDPSKAVPRMLSVIIYEGENCVPRRSRAAVLSLFGKFHGDDGMTVHSLFCRPAWHGSGYSLPVCLSLADTVIIDSLIPSGIFCLAGSSFCRFCPFGRIIPTFPQRLLYLHLDIQKLRAGLTVDCQRLGIFQIPSLTSLPLPVDRSPAPEPSPWRRPLH